MEIFKKNHEEILSQMKLHLEKKSCCRSHQEYLDLNPVEPGLAYSDGYFIYQSDCPEARKLNVMMKQLLSSMKMKNQVHQLS